MDPSTLNEHELYAKLSKYAMLHHLLVAYEYPIPDPREPGRRKAVDRFGGVKKTIDGFVNPYTCERCKVSYHVDTTTGVPISGQCTHHSGRLRKLDYSGKLKYYCCREERDQPGCTTKPYHVNLGESLSSNYTGFVETRHKPEKGRNEHGIYALDCEMCYTTHGRELTQITVIDCKKRVVYEKLAKPQNMILDYNTQFTGLKAGSLDGVRTSLADVQRDLLEMFSSETILIGHSLNHDMRALKIFHKTFVDVVDIYPHRKGLPYRIALQILTRDELNRDIQTGSGHDSKEDAEAALDLVMLEVRRRG